MAVAGGTASGKSTLAQALSLQCPQSVALIHLDDYYEPAHDPLRGVWTVSADGHAVLDWNHPGSIDETALTHAIDAALLRPGVRLVVAEGLFALSLPCVVRRAAWRVYVDTPDDIRLARKILRKIETQHQDPRLSLRNYLQTGRDRHTAHVAPTRAAADLIIDGTTSEADMLAAVMPLIKPTLTPPPTTPPPTRGVRTLTHTPHTPAFAL
jgi:uridine kinase